MKVDVEFIATEAAYKRAAGHHIQPACWGVWEIKDKADFEQRGKKYNKAHKYEHVLRCCVSDKDLKNFNQSNSQSDNSP